MIPAPEPGIYPGVDPETYFEWDAISNSGLSDFARSPARFRWVQDHPQERKETASTRFGTFVHCAMLEPNEVENRYEHCPGPWNKNPYKQAKDAAEAMGLTPLHTEEWEAIERIRDNAHAHPRVRDILALATATELSCVWPFDGCPVKQRVDIFCRDAAIQADIKTTRSYAEFEGSVGTFGYYRQAAIYLRGLEVLGEKCSEFIFIVVENTPPYEVVPVVINPGDVELGREEFEHLATKMIECRETGAWPGYSSQIETVFLRQYHRYDIERRLAQ